MIDTSVISTLTQMHQLPHYLLPSVRRRAVARRGLTSRVRKAGAEVVEIVDPATLFIRDGWKCQNCGVDTSPFYDVPNHPDQPTVDHIIPLVADGVHSYENTQLLCRTCNCEKAEKITNTLGDMCPELEALRNKMNDQ